MRKGLKLVIVAVLLIGAGVALFAWKEFNREAEDLNNQKPDFQIAATALIQEFEQDETSAGQKYNGKILEVTGIVQMIEKDDSGGVSIFLGDGGLSAVNCGADKKYARDFVGAKVGAEMKLKGECTGMLMDVVLVRCVPVAYK